MSKLNIVYGNILNYLNDKDLVVDILHICCPKHHESQEPLNDLLNSYNNIFIGAKENNYKNIVSVSLGTGVNGYKHNEVSKEIVNRLNELVKDYDIDFTLVLPNEEIYTLYNIK